MYDILIIGAGVSGCAAARELAGYRAKICVLERGQDICEGTSKANSGIIHAGFDAKPGSLKARLNVRGNQLMEQAAEELEIPFRRNGSLVVCTDPEKVKELERLRKNGEKNQVPGLQILGQEKLKELEPYISENACAALYAPTGGIICPFELNLALAENACENGVEFCFGQEVTGIRKEGEGYTVQAASGETYRGRILVNAAGVCADMIHNLVCEEKLEIIPRKGEYILLDKRAGTHVSRTIFTLPGPYGKGVLVTPTVHGNLLVGPTALDIQDKEGTNTTKEGLEKVKEKCQEAVRDIPLEQVITSFAGLRAHEAGDDFVIRESEDGFFDCAGIESPGLTSCLAVGELLGQMISEKLQLPRRQDVRRRRRAIVRPERLSTEERSRLIRENPAYGNIVCRCEMISEGEILEAIHRPLGAKTMDGIKRRVRAGMGRCQGGFCSPRVMELLAREWGMDPLEICKSGPDSRMLSGRVRKDG